MQGNLLVPFLEGLEAAMPPGYSAGSRKSTSNGNSSASYPTWKLGSRSTRSAHSPANSSSGDQREQTAWPLPARNPQDRSLFSRGRRGQCRESILGSSDGQFGRSDSRNN